MSQVIKIIMILDTWLGLVSNVNCRLVTCLDNTEYLNLQSEYESSNEFKASNLLHLFLKSVGSKWFGWSDQI